MTTSNSTNQCNIYLVGAQCTGKTTLTNALSEHFRITLPPEKQPRIIKEVARSVLAKHKFTANDIVSSPDRCLLLQKLILEAQANAESRYLTPPSSPGWFISDRSGADPIAYALAYVEDEYKARSLLNSEHWKELHKRMASSLVVVCEAGMNWLTDDGVRLMPQHRDEWVGFHRLFCRFLDEQRLPYVVLPSVMVDIEERVKFVLANWQKGDELSSHALAL